MQCATRRCQKSTRPAGQPRQNGHIILSLPRYCQTALTANVTGQRQVAVSRSSLGATRDHETSELRGRDRPSRTSRAFSCRRQSRRFRVRRQEAATPVAMRCGARGETTSQAPMRRNASRLRSNPPRRHRLSWSREALPLSQFAVISLEQMPSLCTSGVPAKISRKCLPAGLYGHSHPKLPNGTRIYGGCRRIGQTDYSLSGSPTGINCSSLQSANPQISRNGGYCL